MGGGGIKLCNLTHVDLSTFSVGSRSATHPPGLSIADIIAEKEAAAAAAAAAELEASEAADAATAAAAAAAKAKEAAAAAASKAEAAEAGAGLGDAAPRVPASVAEIENRLGRSCLPAWIECAPAEPAEQPAKIFTPGGRRGTGTVAATAALLASALMRSGSSGGKSGGGGGGAEDDGHAASFGGGGLGLKSPKSTSRGSGGGGGGSLSSGGGDSSSVSVDLGFPGPGQFYRLGESPAYNGYGAAAADSASALLGGQATPLASPAYSGRRRAVVSVPAATRGAQ